MRRSQFSKVALPLAVVMIAVMTAGCLVEPPVPVKKGIPAGKGAVYLSVTIPDSSRTLFPTGWDSLAFSAKFTATGKTEVNKTLPGGSGTVNLETGTWRIDIEARSGSTLVGSAFVTNVVVNQNQTTEVKSVKLLPVTGGAAGTVTWSVEFPNQVTSAKLLYHDANEANQGQIDLLSGSATVNGNNRIQRSGTINLAPGSWWFWTQLNDSNSGESAGRSAAVHVYSSLNTPLSWEFINISTKVESVLIEGGNFNLLTGNYKNLSAIVSPDDAANQLLSWSSSNNSVATVNTNGRVSAVSAGTATITATAQDGSGKTDSVTVTVMQQAIVPYSWTFQTLADGWTNGDTMSIDTVYLNNMTLLGSQRPMIQRNAQTAPTGSGFTQGCLQTGGATATGKYFLQVDYVQGPFNIKLNYTDTSGNNVNGGRTVSIYINGTLVKTSTETAVSYEYTGTDVVTIQLGCSNGIRLFDMLLETPPVKANSVTITGGNFALATGATRTLTANVLPEDTTNKTVTWGSSNSTIASINPSTGLVTAGSTTGTATITATTADGSNKTNSVTVTVIAPAAVPYNWNFRDPAIPNWENYATNSREMNTNAAYENNMTLLGTLGNIRWMPDQNIPSGGTALNFTQGCVQTTGATTGFLRVDGVPGPFVLKLNYTGTNTEVRTIGIYINGELVKTTAGTSGTNAVTDTYEYEGTDLVTIQLTSSAGIRLYNMFLDLPSSAQVPVSSVTIDGGDFSLTTGATRTLTTTVQPNNATNKAVTWGSSATNRATVNANTGLVTAVSAGTAVITATSVADPSKSDSVTVTVTAAAVAVNSVAIVGGNFSIAERDTRQLSATVLPNNATDKSVTWASLDPEVATVNANGLLTAIEAGTATITVTSVADPAKTASITVTVSGPTTIPYHWDFQDFDGWASGARPDNNTSNDAEYENNMTVLATLRPYYYPDQAVPSGSDPYYFTQGCFQPTSASTSSRFLLKIDYLQGPFNLILNYTNNSNGTGRNMIVYINGQEVEQTTGVNGTNPITHSYEYTGNNVVSVQLGCSNNIRLYDVLVENPGSVATQVPVTGVAIDGGNFSLATLANKQLTTTVSPANATNKLVTWSSSNPTVATVSSSGLVTAGSSAGTANITAAATDGSGRSSSVTVTVTTTNIAVTGVNIPTAAPSFSKTAGGTFTPANATLTAEVVPTNATTQGVTWSSSDTSIVTVNANGVVTPVAGYNTVGTQTVTITATSNGNNSAGNKVTATKSVTVTIMAPANPVNSVTITPTTAITFTKTAGGTYSPANTTLTGSVNTNATTQGVTWTSSNTNVLTVNSSGVVTPVVGYNTVGTVNVTITATSNGVGSNGSPVTNTKVIAVTVNAATVAVTGVNIGGDITMAVGDTRQLTATITPTNATNQTVTWSRTGAGTAANINTTTGLITATATGTATFRATSSNNVQSNTITVTVEAAGAAFGPVTFRNDANRGWLETLYVTWNKLAAAEKYKVEYQRSGTSTWTLVDDPLIREYGSYFRVDALGLQPGTYSVRVTPVAGTREGTQATVTGINVIAHDRSGFAFAGGALPGAYNANGTPKDGARILYITDSNKETVSLEMYNNKNNASSVYTGLQAIITAYEKGYESRPTIIRFIGRINEKKGLPFTDSEGSVMIKGKSGAPAMNLTFEGVGNDATAYGWGFRSNTASYAEIRNLGFMLSNTNQKDAVELTKSTYMWVHNCDFFYMKPGSAADQVKGDGSLDTKESSYISLSFNHFWDSGKCNLLGNGTETPGYLTYHHNWYDHSDSRHPRVRWHKVHVYNNFYDGNSTYGIGATRNSSIFAEGNYFLNTKKPMLISMQGSDTKNGTDEKNGTFSSEDGGMIKAYNNSINTSNGPTIEYVAWSSSNPVHFDAYEVTNRDATVPNNVTTKQGNFTYDNNFMSNERIDKAVETPANARTTVTQYAGRYWGSDFSYTFGASDYASKEAHPALMTALNNYTHGLVAIQGGNSPGASGGGSTNPGGGTTNPGGGTTTPGPVTGATICAFNQPGSGGGSVVTTNTAFTLTSANSTTPSGSPVTIGGVSYTYALKLESSTVVTFSTSASMTLKLYLDGAGTVKVDDVNSSQTDSSNIITVNNLAAGTHTIKRNTSGLNLWLIALEP